MSGSRSARRLIALWLAALALSSTAPQADSTVQSLPFSQDWSNVGGITASDDWSGVAGIVGYRGDGLAGTTAIDPQTILGDGGTPVIDVNANQANPSTFTTGGVAEFEIADPVVALQGSGTARAPNLVVSLNTTGLSNVAIAYNLRDIDGRPTTPSRPSRCNTASARQAASRTCLWAS